MGCSSSVAGRGERRTVEATDKESPGQKGTQGSGKHGSFKTPGSLRVSGSIKVSLKSTAADSIQAAAKLAQLKADELELKRPLLSVLVAALDGQLAEQGPLTNVNDFPSNIQDVMKALWTAARSCNSSVPSQASVDVMCGCVIAGIWQAAKAYVGLKDVAGSPLTTQLLRDASWAAKTLAAAGSVDPTASLAASINSQDLSIMHVNPASSSSMPGYALILDRARKQVVVLLTGAQGLSHVLNVAGGPTTCFADGYTNQSLLRLATSLHEEEGSRLESLLKANPGYALHFVGHSVGGSVATLLAYMCNSQNQGGAYGCKASATAFGPLPVFSAQLAHKCSSYVTSLAHKSDAIPRLSSFNLQRLFSLSDRLGETVFDELRVLVHQLRNQALETGLQQPASVADVLKRTRGVVDCEAFLEEQIEECLSARVDATTISDPEGVEPLFPGGNLLLLHVGASGKYYTSQADQSCFAELLVSKDMFQDHRVQGYAEALCAVSA